MGKVALSGRAVGIMQAVLSGVCFGFLGVFGKAAYERGLTPSEFLSLRFLIGGGFLFAIIALTNWRRLVLARRELLACAALGVLGYAVFSSFFFNALSGLSASLTVLLLYTFPAMVAVGGWVFFGERIPRERWLALPLVMAGLVGLIWGDVYVSRPLAVVFGVLAAFFYSGYILSSSRLLKGVDALASAAWIQLFAGLALALVYWRDLGRIGHVVSVAWPVLAGVALIGTIAAMSLFLAALRRLPSWEVSILSAAEAVTGVALAILLLGEKLSVPQLLGGLAVGAAFVILVRPVRHGASLERGPS